MNKPRIRSDRSVRSGRIGIAIGIALTGVVAISGCSAAPSGPTSTDSAGGSGAECPTSSTPVELSYWSWGAGFVEAVDLWNSTNPDIQVTHSDIPTGNAGGYQKMFAALEAGTPPDLAFIEFDNLASFAGQGALLDVSTYLTSDEKSDFLAPALAQVSLGVEGAMYNVPLGGGPMALVYRKDLFTQNNIAVPTTWAEFEAAAAQVQQIDPTASLANFDGYGNANWFAGLASQNDAQWFANEGDAWEVTLNSGASKEVADLWQSMLDAKTASSLATFSPAWSDALAQGKIWSWPTAVWGAGVIKTSAPDTSGNWAVAPLPQWSAGSKVSATWGGGGVAVFAESKNPCEAAEFALWMGNSPDALAILNPAIGIYPTTKSLLASDLFTQPDPFFGGQVIFDEFKAASAEAPNFTFGPSMGNTYASVTDAFAAAVGGGTLSGALDQANESVISSLEKDGFTVK